MPVPRERLPGRPDGHPPNRSSRLIVRPRTTRVTHRVSGGPEEEFDRTMSAKYRMCAREYATARRNKGEYVRGVVCIRCRVQRSMRIDAPDGDRPGSGGYDYHDARGYLLKGGGALTADERSELRLAETGSVRYRVGSVVLLAGGLPSSQQEARMGVSRGDAGSPDGRF